MKKVYKIPFWSRVAIRVADWLPSRVRASIYIDTLNSLDDQYESVEQKDKTSTRLFRAISDLDVETLRRTAYKDGLNAILVDKNPSKQTRKDSKR